MSTETRSEITDETLPERTYDVVVVGAGLMGTMVARSVRNAHPRASILLLDAGVQIGQEPGRHLHDSTDPQIWDAYNQATAADNQALYIGPEFKQDLRGRIVDAVPGMYTIDALGEDAGGMPRASLAWNAGGMSVHWTATTPVPFGSEAFPFEDQVGWERDLAAACRVLNVDHNPFGVTTSGARILQILNAEYGDRVAAGRQPQTMPMSVDTSSIPPWPRIGPDRILPSLSRDSDPQLTYRTATQVLRILIDGDRATGVELKDLRTGRISEVRADQVVVAADTFRSPQLLFASGIRPPALGRYLNEHAFLGATVHVDPARVGLVEQDLPQVLPGEWRAASFWVPFSGPQQPFHGQVVESYSTAQRRADDYQVGLTWYVATELRAENRLEFSTEQTDEFGMPRITVHYGFSAADRQAIEAGTAEMIRIGRLLADDPSWGAGDLMEPGSSLHFTGTVRMGTDEQTSVCDENALVRGTQNVFVAGNGVVPTAVLANSTLAGAVTAIRAGRSVSRALAARA